MPGKNGDIQSTLKSCAIMDENGLKTETNTPIESSKVLEFIESVSEKTTIILDFDETLLLRNSTEEYLDSLRPRILGALLLKFLNQLQPWKWLPDAYDAKRSRDWVRVVFATLLFPWNYFLWKFRARKLAIEYTNLELVESINNNSNLQPLVASLGFKFIINPVLRHIDLNISHCIGCRFWYGLQDRSYGKEELIKCQEPSVSISKTIVVTDSLDDQSLLSQVGFPLLTKWSLSKYVVAMSDIMTNYYVPLFYLEKVKRPNEYMIWNKLIVNHLVPLALALSWTSNVPVIHILGLTFLVVSFWCIYEVGYYENDLVAEKFEKDPKLSKTYHKYKNSMSAWQAWVWSIVLSVFGILLLGINDINSWNIMLFEVPEFSIEIDWHTAALRISAWLVGLILLRCSYWLFNHLDKVSRIWIYPVLQICKYLNFAVLTQDSPVGFALLFSLFLSDWIPYLVCRLGNKKIYSTFPKRLFRTACFLIVTVSLAIGAQSLEGILNVQFLVILLFYIYQSKSQIIASLKSAYPIWKDIELENQKKSQGYQQLSADSSLEKI